MKQGKGTVLLTLSGGNTANVGKDRLYKAVPGEVRSFIYPAQPQIGNCGHKDLLWWPNGEKGGAQTNPAG